MQGYERDKLRRELDEALLPFRLARKRKGDGTGWGGTGWLKSIRQAVGVPVDEVARRLGVFTGWRSRRRTPGSCWRR
jgi:hypothetical protein